MSITFTAEIIDQAKTRGLELTHQEVAGIDQKLNAMTTVRDGKVEFIAGSFLDVPEAVQALSGGYGKPIKQPGTSTALDLPTNATVTQRAIFTNQVAKAGGDAAKREQATKLGNPWAAGRLNRTSQAFITNHNPELAQQLKAQAGVQP